MDDIWNQAAATAKLLTCFNAYDPRGRVGEELNEDIAMRVGRAFGQRLAARRVAVGRDIRPSSPGLARALIVSLFPGVTREKPGPT